MADRVELPQAYLAVVDGLPEAALLFGRDGLVHANREAVRRLEGAGVAPRDVQRVSQLIAPEDEQALTQATARASAGEAVAPMRLTWVAPTGVRLVTSCVFNPITLDGRRYVQLLARDVSHRVAAEQAVARSEARFRALFDHSPVGIALLESGTFALVNAAMCRILGRAPQEIVDRTPDDFTAPADLVLNLDVMETVARGDVARASKRYLRPDGAVVWAELTAVPLGDGAAGGAESGATLAQLRDITVEREATQHLQHLALHDPMTGLGNRTLLDERLQQATLTRGERRKGLALLFLDLDGFKRVNDALGHEVGDRVLRATARRISGAVRPGDTVVRWGGDEFVVLLDGLDDVDEALAVVKRVEAAVAVPIAHRDDELLVTASVGVAYAAPSDRPAAAQLLHDADAALYRSKQSGRNRHSVFDEALRLAASRRGYVERLLREAADGDRVVLHFQPVLDLRTRRVVGAEALLRLRGDDGTLIYPDAFLDIAEDAGLMVAVEHAVVTTACRWLAQQHARGRDLSLSVNVCAKQLVRIDEFERRIRTALDQSGARPDRLVCEVTEHAVLEVDDHVVAGMTRLQELGVEFSVDDFGAGHASINYLHRLPVKEVKIDRSYTARAGHDRPAAAIMRAVAGLARELSMRSVVEGVEHEDAHRLALELGADRGQGYLYARPMPAEDFERYLADQS